LGSVNQQGQQNPISPGVFHKGKRMGKIGILTTRSVLPSQ
jgi:hypothetical protein